MFERLVLLESAELLYIALERIVREMASEYRPSIDAMIAAREALARASGREGQNIYWAKENKGNLFLLQTESNPAKSCPAESRRFQPGDGK